jgi:mannose-6-phosphate isomerase-like protein (cupin superfamily)
MTSEGGAMTEAQVRSMHIPARSGERISFMGMELIWKITPDMSRGAIISFLQIAPPGTGVPMHVHPGEEESVFLVEGNLVFGLGDEVFDVAPGDVVNMPRGTPHGFRIVGDHAAQILFTLDLSPTSDYETMFNGLVGLAPGDFEQIRAVCAANNVEFISPPQMP